MEIHLSPDIQAKLDQMAADSNTKADQLIEFALEGYFLEMDQTREMLDSRYDDLESDRVQPIDGEEYFAQLMEKTEAARHRYKQVSPAHSG